MLDSMLNFEKFCIDMIGLLIVDVTIKIAIRLRKTADNFNRLRYKAFNLAKYLPTRTAFTKKLIQTL